MQQTSDLPGAEPHDNPATPLKARTFLSMGTVISLTLATDVAAGQAAGQAAEDELAASAAVVERIFRDLDETFSLYRPDSEASRLARGDLTLRHASTSMRQRYAEAHDWRLLTEGAFNSERPDGVLDLSGIVKGHAIREAGLSLSALGRLNWCLNAGGDVVASGSPIPGSCTRTGTSNGSPWLAGIVDPTDLGHLVAAYPLAADGHHLALATSGSAERGEHIWRQQRRPPEFVQVSVAAPDIVTADVLATAVVSGGSAMLDRAVEGWDVAILAVRADGSLVATPAFHRTARAG